MMKSFLMTVKVLTPLILVLGSLPAYIVVSQYSNSDLAGVVAFFFVAFLGAWRFIHLLENG